jgi:glutathione peroxidase-family protein
VDEESCALLRLQVNTASKCGFTPQLDGLERLQKKIGRDDFAILGFPCNQFAKQGVSCRGSRLAAIPLTRPDPGSDEEIQAFCRAQHGVTFRVLAKTEVNGDAAEPVWRWLKAARPGLMGLERVKWNFEKFLVGRDGRVLDRWASIKTPESLEQPVLKALASSSL